ncbi:hypothetical protein F383_06746 [Gossypium arboreum]|uniref:Uncharacterized protein n=1 Tax=Gossypium arboreum TaxID=29729 RepID=A0A0B0NS98_GOSAR|nr:hypothetical protein F383_06746 [Gossypium arboreum]
MSRTWHWHRYETLCKTIASYRIQFMIPCKTISGIWHWHLTMCMRIPKYPLVFQVVQREIQRFFQS